MLISFSIYLILGVNIVFKGRIGSLANIKKKGDSLEFSLGIKLLAAHTKGTTSSHSNLELTCFDKQAFKKL